MMKIKKNSKTIILIAIAILIVSLVIFYFLQSRSDSNNHIQQNSDQTKPLNLDPPTDEEKQQAEDNKKRLIEEDARLKNQTQPSESNKTIVKPEITYAEQNNNNIEVGSFVPSIFENNGTCTATFKKDSRIISRQVKSVAEGRATYCPLFRLPVEVFAEKGTWSVSISYESSVYKGTSSESKVEVN